MSVPEPAPAPTPPVTPAPAAIPADPVVETVLKGALSTGTGRSVVGVSFATAVFVFAVSQRWIPVDTATRDFIVTWMPVEILGLNAVVFIAERVVQGWVAKHWLQNPR